MKNRARKVNRPVKGRVAAVPVVMQMDVEESGAASLCSVLAYYDCWIPIAQARLDCGISRDGTKIENIVRAAEKHGMRAGLRALDAAALRRELVFIMLSALAVALAGIMLPVFQRVLTDRMLTGLYGSWTKPFLLLFAAVGAGEVAALAIREKHMLKLRTKMSMASNTSFFWHGLHMPMEFFFQRTAGDLINRQSVNEGIATTLIEVLAPILLNAAMVIFYLIVMLRYSAFMTCIGVISALGNILLSRFIMKRRVNLAGARRRIRAAFRRSPPPASR